MRTLIKHEINESWKNFLIWLLCISGMSFFCIVLFPSLKESMAGLKDSFASMGLFSKAFGMNKLDMGILNGFYAIEVGTMHCLGGAMFAAMIGTAMLSKEEEHHTSEFLLSLPISRRQTVAAKYMVIIIELVAFNVVSVLFYLFGIAITGETINYDYFSCFHGMQFLMQLEIASLCFLLSSVSKRNKIGAGIGIALIGYVLDMMARIIPALTNILFVTPFSYANASSIFSGERVSIKALLFGVCLMVIAIILSFCCYEKRDLDS